MKVQTAYRRRFKAGKKAGRDRRKAPAAFPRRLPEKNAPQVYWVAAESLETALQYMRQRYDEFVITLGCAARWGAEQSFLRSPDTELLASRHKFAQTNRIHFLLLGRWCSCVTAVSAKEREVADFGQSQEPA